MAQEQPGRVAFLYEQVDAGAPEMLPAEVGHVHHEGPLVHPLSEFLPAT
jgi:hypothetical protein